jgi:predicted naringenin-chalcone synthase
VVASCTGFVAPGVDQIIAAALGLDQVERTLIGFMGCYAAAAALRSAFHIVRSDQAARVLLVTVELSTLHLQFATELEPLLAELQFGDGAAAALVTADPSGIELISPFTATLPDSGELIQWTIGDTGFEMILSGEVPGRIGAALQEARHALISWVPGPPVKSTPGPFTPAAAPFSMPSNARWSSRPTRWPNHGRSLPTMATCPHPP